MRIRQLILAACASSLLGAAQAEDLATYSWRYYRPGNTGIQGDTNEALYIGADDDPWIGGYSPIAEEGGFAKFLYAQKSWDNVSNIDYPVIGSANDVGFCRVTDMVADGQGRCARPSR
jgi:hypothetical protein